MVRITNNLGSERVVTNGAYNQIFKRLGWTPVEDNGEEVEPAEVIVGSNPPEDENPDLTEDDSIVVDSDEPEEAIELEDDLTEKPLSEMTMDELRELAELKGVNITGLKKAREIRAAIRKAL